MVTLVIGLVAVGILAAIAIPVFLHQQEKAQAELVESMTCDDVVAGALAPGADNYVNPGLPAPDEVRDVRVDTEYRPAPEPPPGHHSLLLLCTGTGTWADGSQQPVTVAGRLDADGSVSFAWAVVP